MKASLRPLLIAVCSASLWSLPITHAGDFKRITIDGSFADWAGVQPAYVDAEDATDGFDLKEIYVANDEAFLYVRVRLYQPRDFSSFHHQVIIDADADTATGHGWAGVGSELLIEDGAPWQQKNGAFNEGVASALDWAQAPTGQISEFEVRISRSTRDSEDQPVFTKDAIALAFRVVNLDWQDVDIAPGTEGVPYQFALAPAKATGSRSLISLTGTAWRYQDAGTDPGSDWLSMSFDDTQAGWKSGAGLLGFGSPTGSYPAPVKTTLTSGRTTYYFRAPFTWDNDSSGVALVVSNYVSAGAIVYLNGAEAKRLRLPASAVSYSTLATGGPAQPGAAEVFSLPTSALVVGQNWLEVEVHAATTAPQALAFGLDLFATDSLPPSIEDPTQPVDRAVVEGETTTFAVGRVLGTEPLYYLWFRDGSAIADATNATYTIPNVLVSDAGRYSVEVSNATGAKVTSRSALLTTSATPVTIVDPSQPADRTVAEGESAPFQVDITGSPTLWFQWLKDGAAIDAATAAQYFIDRVALTDAGGYSVIVSNRLGSVTSRTARLTVNTDKIAPQIVEVTGSGTQVTVMFSEALDETSAAQSANYTLTGNVKVQSATLDPLDPRTVTLNTTPLTFGTTYTLGVNGVKDRFNNVANTSSPFRATIRIDGNFDDWAGIPVLRNEPQDTPEGLEFKDISVASDADFLYIRFNFYADVGELPVDNYYHIFFDTDNDPATGLANAGLGGEMMIENGGGYQQKNGGFNEGVVQDLGFDMAPQAKALDYECRISRKTVFKSDGQVVFGGPAIALGFQLVNKSWVPVETVPQGDPIVFTFTASPPMNPGPLRIQMLSGQVEISWPEPGVLESRETLSTGTWAPVTNASNPYRVSPAGQQRFYRLRL